MEYTAAVVRIVILNESAAYRKDSGVVDRAAEAAFGAGDVSYDRTAGDIYGTGRVDCRA